MMDADKDKLLSEKSSPETAMDDAENHKPLPKNSPPQNIKKETMDDQHLPQNHGVDAPKPGTSSDPENAEDSEMKGEQKPAQLKSIPLPPDLKKLSADIDKFLSSLSNLSAGGRSTAPDLPILVEQFMVLVEAEIEEYDSGVMPVKWTRLTVEQSASFLETVNRVSSLSKALSKFSSEHKYASSINDIGRILQCAMSYVEEEFKLLLEDYKIHDSSDHPTNKNIDSKHKQYSESNENPYHESSPPAEETNISGYSKEILSDLVRLSKAMITGGYEAECCQVYFVVRRNALEENLNKLGFEKHSIDDVHKMSWESLERETESWSKIFKQMANLHFSSERKLSEAVFSGYPSISQNMLGSLSHGVTLHFLNFAEAVALTKRSGEKLFKFLDIYETLRDTLPVIDNFFPEEWAVGLENEASIIRSHLGEAMISIFNELENSIKADSGKTQVAGGAVHPLTKYIMNYLECACEYKGSLEQVFREHGKKEKADSNPGSEYNYKSQQTQNPSDEKEVIRQSPFQAQIIKIMELLDANVEGKSKLYKDPSLSSIFMMNNGRYMLKKIKWSPGLNSLMGETWYRKKSSDLRQYHKGYQRETWGKLLHCLHPEGLTVNGKVMKPVLKERFKSFNAMFDEIHKTQSTWVVGDEQLQSELRVSISNMVIPAYRSFLGRYSQTFTPGRQTEKYVKFQAEDIEAYVDDLFDGSAAPTGRKKV
ncbi:Exocyst complex component EXO70B1 [Sesamum alatum]|uniref:Exocyst subunit Exo70 family protein n=1 Tax=Sesamum alatum TaxID=300844 RepID=A0AAE1XU07_9LAMI|nr:Exocyst complex component EXO70B1 [Sesamum alatum]